MLAPALKTLALEQLQTQKLAAKLGGGFKTKPPEGHVMAPCAAGERAYFIRVVCSFGSHSTYRSVSSPAAAEGRPHRAPGGGAGRQRTRLAMGECDHEGEYRHANAEECSHAWRGPVVRRATVRFARRMRQMRRLVRRWNELYPE